MSAECSTRDIPPGYKHTEMGVIPEDWSSICYADYLNIISGLGFKKAEYCDVGIRLLRIDNVSYGQISWDSIAYLPIQYIEKFPNLVLSEGDILLALNRPITNNQLKLARVGAEDSPAILYQRVGKIEITNSKLDKTFAYFILRKFIRKFVEESSVGSDQPFVSTTALKKIHIPLPPTLAEQESIAEALSDVDAFIESLEQLIAKKRQIKQGTMQELLTGKRRLPGFGEGKGYKQTDIGVIPEDWGVIYLSDVGRSLTGLTYSPSNVRDFGTLVLRSSNIQNGKLVFENNVYVDMDLPERVIVEKDDILICVRNGSRQLIGKCALIDERAAGDAFGAFMSIYRSKYSKYVFYQFQSEIIQRQINEIMGATINQITNKDMASFTVPFPQSDEEKNAIAAILSDMDSEITSLEEKLAKARQIKQGMMQELLTGKIRLL